MFSACSVLSSSAVLRDVKVKTDVWSVEQDETSDEAGEKSSNRNSSSSAPKSLREADTFKKVLSSPTAALIHVND